MRCVDFTLQKLGAMVFIHMSGADEAMIWRGSFWQCVRMCNTSLGKHSDRINDKLALA